jgi:hypothetical protein
MSIYDNSTIRLGGWNTTNESEQLWNIWNATAGFNLPPYDEVDLSNYVASDKPKTIILKQSGANVTTLTLSYDGSNNLTSIVRS